MQDKGLPLLLSLIILDSNLILFRARLLLSSCPCWEGWESSTARTPSVRLHCFSSKAALLPSVTVRGWAGGQGLQACSWEWSLSTNRACDQLVNVADGTHTGCRSRCRWWPNQAKGRQPGWAGVTSSQSKVYLTWESVPGQRLGSPGRSVGGGAFAGLGALGHGS